ncbi:putative receptor-like protein kinase [Cucumis melo var. makuwa]|uniref:Receptor-like protein kinase n=1 Tax=Cucumis melo var. makuwa TaxID=1194695 RepID=A0A5A7VGM6_CUCMM|nr:putative receptor-like protein kinase [Cucumis melo var. makuwa]
MAIMLSLSHLLSLLLLQLISSSLAYFPPNKYFLDCGSKSDTELINKRRFVGDAKPIDWSIYPGKSKVVKNNTIPKNINEIYQTARVYNKATWYVFKNITPNGTYVVRLHFFPTLPQIMSQARFSVSVSSGFVLLSNFSVGNDLKKAVVKEFAFAVNEGPFGIEFSPLESSDLAFVNAIELFLAPDEFKPDSVYPISPEVRRRDSMYTLAFNAWNVVYRVWMGSGMITPETDTLWRTWLPDSEFMPLQSSARTVTFNGKLNFNRQETIYVAPVFVYSNAKVLDMNTSTRSRDSTLTWVFNVKKKSKYFLRLLWCDIANPNSKTFNFDVFIGVNQTSLQSTEVTQDNVFALPFWYEFIIVTDRSGFFNVGIGLINNDPLSRAFLNGIEIMELIDKSFVGVVDLSMGEEKQSPKMIIVGVCVGGVVIIGLIIGLAVFCFVRNRKLRKHRPMLLPQNDPSSEKIVSIADIAPNLNLELKIPFGVINDATDGFDDKKMIGIGGFGKVYAGRIGEKDVAVKRSQPGHGQGIKEFHTEVIIFSQIRHRFLVSLYGYCDENQEMILVYEYMEGGTLKDYLYGSKAKDKVPLTWQKRLEICIDAAKGLHYLHTGSTATIIIHRDIKTTNILLDKELNAKVADFGISKTGVPDAKELDITIRGTYGYLDPEYFNTGQLTEKSDVYSFGVVLFEVLSARAPIVKTAPSEETNLADWAVLCKSRGEIEKVIDPFLMGTIEANSLRKFVEVAEKCLNEVGANRPSMQDVLYDLELALQFQYTPVGEGKGYEGMSTSIVEAPWEIDSGILDRIPSKGINDSVMLDEDSTTVNARELAAEFKIDCAR